MTTQASRWKTGLLTATFWLGIYLACVLPTDHAQHALFKGDLRIANLVGTAGMLAVFAAVAACLRRAWATALVVTCISVALLVRCLHFGLVKFAGFGFGSEVFIHLEPESVRVAWTQYRPMIVLMLAGMSALIGIMIVCASRYLRPGPRIAAVLFACGLGGAVACRSGLPEWKAIDATLSWYGPKTLAMSGAELDRWRASGLVQVDLKRKSDISAHLPPRPRNLILLYIESGGLRILDHPAYPGLAPFLAEQISKHALLPSIHASAYVTIEGLVNSQCGTLFPFEHESGSMTGQEGAAVELPCLGDVLHKAGYVQSYLGGAELGFAGKGYFLGEHGYDTVKGQEEWVAQGLLPRSDTWGISDADLFEQSLLELERLRASGKPFNLTLLTIGTHIPGFTYSECKPYGKGKEPFLNAIHCTDQLVKRWVQHLSELGYLDDSVLIITGDHHVFPNPDMKRLFGDDAIEDRRLPLIVLGNDMPAAQVKDGASLDLAPTLLDLLDVQHDAVFALGRSLLRAESRREYFPSRYLDVFRGKVIEAAEGSCNGPSPPDLPLNRCDKDSLLTLLRVQHHAFSRPVTHLSCKQAERTRIFVPDASDQAMSLFVEGVDQAARFAWSERPVDADAHGLFVLAFASDGLLLERAFIPAGEQREAVEALQRFDKTRGMLAIWRGKDAARPPAWFGAIASGASVAVRGFDRDSRIRATLEGTHAGTGTEFILDQDQCEAMLVDSHPAPAPN